MKLLIISNMAHFVRDGQVVGHGPTAREISCLASLFETVRHVGCLHQGVAPALMLPYESDKVQLIPVSPTGGSTALDKLRIARVTPSYLRAILEELRNADVVHVRCPANIPLIAIVLLALVRHPKKRWIKYAGNWNPQGREAWSYTFQRWWLRRDFARAKVTVNGTWPGQAAHIHSFANPCLTDEELAEGRQTAKVKALESPMRLLFVGQLNTAKGTDRALHIVAGLKAKGTAVTLDLVGDGPERPAFEALVDELGIRDQVQFHGWLPRPALNENYSRTHILLFPSSASEGWPKVLSEAMAYGAVPIAGAVSSIPQYLERFGTGMALPPDDISAFVEAIRRYVADPALWAEHSQNSVRSADEFTYSHYLECVRRLLEIETC